MIARMLSIGYRYWNQSFPKHYSKLIENTPSPSMLSAGYCYQKNNVPRRLKQPHSTVSWFAREIFQGKSAFFIEFFFCRIPNEQSCRISWRCFSMLQVDFTLSFCKTFVIYLISVSPVEFGLPNSFFWKVCACSMCLYIPRQLIHSLILVMYSKLDILSLQTSSCCPSKLNFLLPPNIFFLCSDWKNRCKCLCIIEPKI